ncbi:hypothetical protein A9Q98_06390 [Thalassotalea sp. 42_200_T64]|nr:hypothetical protein A9Q98_06390 [Thalassotalea sp. 42_200_T64]
MKLLALGIILSTVLVGCGGSSGGKDVVESEPAPIVDDADSGIEAGDDSSITATNVLLIISDDQGLDASAQYALSDDIPNTPL